MFYSSSARIDFRRQSLTSIDGRYVCHLLVMLMCVQYSHQQIDVIKVYSAFFLETPNLTLWIIELIPQLFLPLEVKGSIADNFIFDVLLSRG